MESSRHGEVNSPWNNFMKAPKNVTTRHCSYCLIAARQLMVSERAPPPQPFVRSIVFQNGEAS